MLNTDPVLKVKNLSISFPSRNEMVLAVNGVSFEVFEGETIGIVGESGSGKSVTVMSLLGLLDQAKVEATELSFSKDDHEQVNLLDQAGRTWEEIRGKAVGFIFQEPMAALNPVLKCGYQVDEVLKKHLRLSAQEAKSRTLDLFTKVQLPQVDRIYNAYPHQLSGGQQQRVMIAMALACNPKLLIADEPTTALDVRVQAEILKLLHQLKHEINGTLLFISHDLAVIKQMADRIIVMKKGEIVEAGTAQKILEAPEHPYTKALLACRPRLDERLLRLPTFGAPERMVRQEPMAHSEEVILQVKNTSVSFKTATSWRKKTVVRALKNVDLSIQKGEILGLVGESGSGKTTLGRSIIRLQEIDEGNIIYKDQLLQNWDRKALAKEMQMIFQNPYAALNPRKTIGEAILEPLVVHQIGANDKERQQRVLQLLEQVQLDPSHYYRLPHEFSGGQRQRICIARALTLSPKFLICDECVASLDVSIQADILNLLADLREQQELTILFISHDLSVVNFLCDRVAVMESGQIVEYGGVEQVIHQPKMKYTQALIKAVPRI